MTNPEGSPSPRTASALTATAATVGALLSGGPALAQPASIGAVAVGSERASAKTSHCSRCPVVDDRGDENQWFGGRLINKPL
jgi:hypothetical protein